MDNIVSRPSIEREVFIRDLTRKLKQSKLSPGTYFPSAAIKDNDSIAVFADGLPIILCGWTDDPLSQALAIAITTSPSVLGILALFYPTCKFTVRQVAGHDIQWPASVSAIVESEAGVLEIGDSSGKLMAVVLNDPEYALTTALSIQPDVLRSLYPAFNADGF
jgi:hypothetical protein